MDERLRSRITSLLAQVSVWLPSRSRDWAQAMIAESSQARTLAEFFRWVLGTAVVVVRLFARQLLFGDTRQPIEFAAAAVYLLAFSGHIFFHLVAEVATAGIHEPWSEAWFPLLCCFSLSLIPALIAVGVWLCDDLARKLALGFAVVDIAVIAMFVNSNSVTTFRATKFVCDVAVLIVMLSPRAKKACSWRVDDSSGGRLLDLAN